MNQNKKIETIFSEYRAEKTPESWQKALLPGMSSISTQRQTGWPSWLPALVTAATVTFVLWSILGSGQKPGIPVIDNHPKHLSGKKDDITDKTICRNAIRDLYVEDEAARRKAMDTLLKHTKDAQALVDEAYRQSWHLVIADNTVRSPKNWKAGNMVASFENLGKHFDSVSNPDIDWETHNLVIAAIGDRGGETNGLSNVDVQKDKIIINIWERNKPRMSAQWLNVNCLGIAVPKSELPVEINYDRKDVDMQEKTDLVNATHSTAYPELRFLREKLMLADKNISGGEEKEGLRVHLWPKRDSYNSKDAMPFYLVERNELNVTAADCLFEVRIENNGNLSLLLPGNGRESAKWKPYCYFEIKDSQGKVLNYPEVMLPEPTQPLDQENFVSVSSGNWFNPFGPTKHSKALFFAPDRLLWTANPKPGTYTVTFHFSTQGIQSAECDPNDKLLVEQLKKVPEVELTSNTITIEVK